MFAEMSNDTFFLDILVIKSRAYLIFIPYKINFLKKEDQNQKFFLYNFFIFKKGMKIKKPYSIVEILESGNFF